MKLKYDVELPHSKTVRPYLKLLLGGRKGHVNPNPKP